MNEWSGIGNHNTAEFWEYDTRTGRRLNLEPKSISSESSYLVLGNNPNLFADPFGDVIKFMGRITFGPCQIIVVTKESTDEWNAMLKFAEDHVIGTEEIKRLQNSPNVYEVYFEKNIFTPTGKVIGPGPRYVSGSIWWSPFLNYTSKLYLDPNLALITNRGYEMSPIEVVLHELDHAYNDDVSPLQSFLDHVPYPKTDPNFSYDYPGEMKVITGIEQDAARKIGFAPPLGYDTMVDHGGHPIEVKSWLPKQFQVKEKDEKKERMMEAILVTAIVKG